VALEADGFVFLREEGLIEPFWNTYFGEESK
jgi:hypothetical protein